MQYERFGGTSSSAVQKVEAVQKGRADARRSRPVKMNGAERTVTGSWRKEAQRNA
jgi:hypothetical protein